MKQVPVISTLLTNTHPCVGLVNSLEWSASRKETYKLVSWLSNSLVDQAVDNDLYKGLRIPGSRGFFPALCHIDRFHFNIYSILIKEDG